jgi:predicted SAM-dependent methyltransferase
LKGLNCGCGRTLEAGWINIDLMQAEDEGGRTSETDQLLRIDDTLYYLQHDVRQPFPIEDQSFDCVYSEHLLEHLELPEAAAWLSEVHRLLRPGGLVRISTPSLRLYAEGYSDPEQKVYEEHRRRLMELPLFKRRGVPERRGWMLNQAFQLWDHHWIYDAGEIQFVAGQAGFDPEALVERSFQDGELPEVAALDRAGRNDISLYVEFRKSGAD